MPFAAALVLLGAACGGRTPRTAPTPKPIPKPVPKAPPPPPVARAPLPQANPKLPQVPEVRGPLKIAVVYPPENALITSRDSNFIFGSVGNGDAGLTINGALVPVWPNGAFMGWVANPPVDSQQYDIVAYTATDTARLSYPVRTLAAHPREPSPPDTVVPVRPAQLAELRDDSLDRFVDDTDRFIIGRPTPTGTYHWFLFPGTLVHVTGYLGDKARVALDDKQEIWVDRNDVKLRADTAARETSTLGPARLESGADWIDLKIPASSPPAYVVDEDERSITLTLYASGGPSDLTFGDGEDYLRTVNSRYGARTVYRLDCTRSIYGYLPMYHDGVMTFRLRRPPHVDPKHPLRGLTIAVDPGHPPIGATGPTGLYEPVPTLAVGFRVRDMLVARGAHVVMTRTDPGPVALGARPIMARRANANALVSIHLNALPDGMNPLRSNGTGTYYFHPQAKRFASLVQASLVEQLGLRDLGIFHENLALARPTWMPSILTEGLFIIMPDQEAAIRTPEYQAAYARGIVDGLAQFFATFAQ